jgi:hypothetical protein
VCLLAECSNEVKHKINYMNHVISTTKWPKSRNSNYNSGDFKAGGGNFLGRLSIRLN